MAKTKTRFNLIAELHDGLLKKVEVTKSGTVRLKRRDVKELVETILMAAAKKAAGGERVRLPILGALVRKEVEARKGGVKTINPFTKEPMVTKARPATKNVAAQLKRTTSAHLNWTTGSQLTAHDTGAAA